MAEDCIWQAQGNELLQSSFVVIPSGLGWDALHVAHLQVTLSYLFISEVVWPFLGGRSLSHPIVICYPVQAISGESGNVDLGDADLFSSWHGDDVGKWRRG
jgi:hypothetical protein